MLVGSDVFRHAPFNSLFLIPLRLLFSISLSSHPSDPQSRQYEMRSGVPIASIPGYAIAGKQQQQQQLYRQTRMASETTGV